jgi:hypothetical protein
MSVRPDSVGARAREEIGHEGVLEEIAVQSFQRWIRASAQPIVGGVDWFAMRNAVLKPLPARTPALTLFPRKPSARLRLAVCTDALRWASRSRPGCVFGDAAALCHPRLWCSTTVG